MKKYEVKKVNVKKQLFINFLVMIVAGFVWHYFMGDYEGPIDVSRWLMLLCYILSVAMNIQYVLEIKKLRAEIIRLQGEANQL